MKKCMEQATDLLMDALLEQGRRFPCWLRWIFVLIWTAVYVALMLIVLWLAKDQILWAICIDGGFCLIYAGTIFMYVQYRRRQLNKEKKAKKSQ